MKEPDKTTIKKALYKEKPTAHQNGSEWSDKKCYSAWIESLQHQQFFEVPYSDMGDGKFKDEMPAHELIRWMV